MIIIDTHVHLYAVYNMAFFFDCAYKNFEVVTRHQANSSSGQFVLMLTETTRHNWFSETTTRLKAEKVVIFDRWSIQKTNDKNCICAVSNTNEKLFIIKGYQIVTKENLEVLALGLDARIADGLALEQTIAQVLRVGSMPVLPWGVGKWLGKRGRIINNLLNSDIASQIALGDNGGRPGIFPVPEQFTTAEQLGIPIFPGTDPLPLASEEKKVGRCCLVYQKELDDQPISHQVIQLLKNREIEFKKKIVLENNFRFLVNQLLLRWQK